MKLQCNIFSCSGDNMDKTRHLGEGGYNSRTSGHFIPSSTYFVHGFGVMGQNRRYQLLYKGVQETYREIK